MKLKLDKDGDALYFRLRAGTIVESEEVRPGVMLDFDEDDQVIGVELLQVSDLARWLRAQGRSRFLLTAPPLRLPGAVGSPVTPVATV